MLVPVTRKLKETLRIRGVELFHSEVSKISDATTLEPPCSLKWMQIENKVSVGAFSYAVSGYYSEVSIGRYVSIGEQVQIGRSNHALTWVSTSPFFYLRSKMFAVGDEFSQSEQYHAYSAPPRPGATTTQFRSTIIGNDVYIGHGAFILPGVTVGDGAIIGAMAVVTKNVPPYGIVAGNPARLVKMRQPPLIVAGLLKSAWWRFAPWQLKDIDCSAPEKAIDQFLELAEREAPYAPESFRVADVVNVAD